MRIRNHAQNLPSQIFELLHGGIEGHGLGLVFDSCCWLYGTGAAGQLAARDRVSQIFLQLPRGPGDLAPDRASAVFLQQARRRHFLDLKSLLSLRQ
jgi:hypothetical protein